MATQDKSLVDCYYFLLNQCTKGEKCEYRHCAAAIDNPSNCKFWQEGKCNKKECIFRHPTITDKATTPCYYMMHGGCMRGLSCPFSHAMVTNPNTVVLKELEELKKKQEEELEQLRKLQQQTKAEVEKLRRSKDKGADDVSLIKDNSKPKGDIASRLGPRRAQSEIDSSATITPSPITTEPKTSPSNKPKVEGKKQSDVPPQPFVTTSKRLQQELPKNENQTTSENQKRQKRNKPKNNPQQEESVSDSSANMNFGIKTLDEILQEKTQPQQSQQPQSQQTTNTTTEENNNKKSIDIETLRKKNELKFKQTPSTNTVTLPTTTTDSIETTKRKLTNSQEVQQSPKRSKPDREIDSTEPLVATTITKAISTEVDEFDLDEEDIDIGTNEPIDDKEFDELIK